MIYDILVIGAGASGLAAAISAAKTDSNIKIAVAEAMPRVGKKILATGNGRCNLTNLNAKPADYRNSNFVAEILKKYSPKIIIDFFRSIGIMCRPDSEGRVYPMSNTATSVLDALRNEAERRKINFICDTHIDSIKKTNGIFIAGNICAHRVILSTGGCSSPSQGSDGSGYELLKMLGHRVTSVYPGLVQLTTEENTKAVKGIRVKACVSLLEKNIQKDFSKGEVLFTDYGLSGIAIMDISRSVTDGKYICNIDMVPSCERKEAVNFLLSLDKSIMLEDALAGFVPKKVGQYVLKSMRTNSTAVLGELTESEIYDVVSALKNFSFKISGTRGFKDAQITVGGADVNEFDPITLESKRVDGLFCTGELLDVDSVCGGYNLQWAWASGLNSGRFAALK